MRFDSVLIANRGEIARRIIRSCRDQGYRTIAVFSDADGGAHFVSEADEAVHIGPSPSNESYLRIDRLLDAAQRTGAGAIHPGYGFLAENAEFAQACADAGVIFIGPTANAIRVMGSKIASKRLMLEHGVPVIPGYAGDDQSAETLLTEAQRIGFPLLLKASAGGGGKGMRVITAGHELGDAIAAAKREALAAFGDDTLFLEKLVEKPRHIEFQIFGDEHGHVVHLFERECSIQRRHQKIIEESPSTALDTDLRQAMGAAAVAAARAIDYRNAGTVELLLGADRQFYFLEMNTRLQVEHPVTEMTTGLDLVALQLTVAQGAALPFTQSELRQRGHAIECRIYSENPANQFLPTTGTIVDWHFPDLAGLRVDSGVESGSPVPIHYDPMLAKVITHGDDRPQATRRMIRALEQASIQGVVTNRAFLLALLREPAWHDGDLDTGFIARVFGDAGWHPATEAEHPTRAALLATLREIERRRQAQAALPSLPIGYRNSRWRDADERWLDGDQEITVRYRAQGHSSVTMHVAEQTVTVTMLSLTEHQLSATIDGHRVSARLIDQGASVHVHCQGHSTTLRRADRFPEGASDGAAGGCNAPMPGKVTQVLVSANERVSAGQPLLVMEAMKMEHTIRAASDGVVSRLLVEVGEQVEGDQPLIELEAGADA